MSQKFFTVSGVDITDGEVLPYSLGIYSTKEKATTAMVVDVLKNLFITYDLDMKDYDNDVADVPMRDPRTVTIKSLEEFIEGLNGFLDPTWVIESDEINIPGVARTVEEVELDQGLELEY